MFFSVIHYVKLCEMPNKLFLFYLLYFTARKKILEQKKNGLVSSANGWFFFYTYSYMYVYINTEK